MNQFNQSEILKDLINLPIEKVRPNPNQPRKQFRENALNELADSIRENGILQPILVRQMGDHFEIIAGERRFRAAKLAELKRIPAIVKKFDERETKLAALIENIQREDLNPIEEAESLKEILLNYELTHDLLAKKLGRSRSAITNKLRLLQLPGSVKELISEGRISAGHAKMLAGLTTDQEVKFWTRRILKDRLSVFETEKQIAEDKSGKTIAKGNIKLVSDPHIKKTEEWLMEALGAKVKIKRGRKRNLLEIEFYDRDDLERVVENIISVRD
ncbi:MAG: ParB/RepB/Spo0J family partition protein [Candidatus Riflebacteria bacterium]|nr:ParB/RepB/Spo0J family partition protein [Candidatus Riflebacteria bacterium]